MKTRTPIDLQQLEQDSEQVQQMKNGLHAGGEAWTLRYEATGKDGKVVTWTRTYPASGKVGKPPAPAANWTSLFTASGKPGKPSQA